MSVVCTLAVTWEHQPISEWGVNNLESLDILHDEGEDPLCLIEKRTRLVEGIKPIILPIERAELAKVLFQ